MKKTKSLRERLIPAFLLASLLSITMFAVLSQIRMRINMKQSLHDRIQGGMDKADQCLDMVLDKYETILYDLCTDDEVVAYAEKINEDQDDLTVNSSQLRRYLSHMSNRNIGVEGVLLTLKNGKKIFYDHNSSSSANSSWMNTLEIPSFTGTMMYQVPDEPVIYALEAQIDPHFLYNTLDTINWKAIDREEYEISDMVGALADILRYAVKNAGGETNIQRELYWLEQYMLLQSAKLGKPLQTVTQVPERIMRCKIHKLLLQPFVENAIKYAFKNKEGECILKIRMEEADGQLHIVIEDNGRGLSLETMALLNNESADMDDHLGIMNVRKRLQLYYPGQANIYFESKQNRYTKVHLFIPAAEEDEDENRNRGR